MVTENTMIWEIGFRLVRTFYQNLDHLLVLPAVKYAAFGFGGFIIFSKNYLIPKKIWKRTMKTI